MTEILKTLPSLKTILVLDAVASAVTGIGLTLGGAPLAALLGASVSALLPTGLFLVAYGLLVARLATRVPIPSSLVLLVVLANTAWVIASLLVVSAEWLELTTIGGSFLVLQAMVVFVFALFQLAGLKILNMK